MNGQENFYRIFVSLDLQAGLLLGGESGHLLRLALKLALSILRLALVSLLCGFQGTDC